MDIVPGVNAGGRWSRLFTRIKWFASARFLDTTFEFSDSPAKVLGRRRKRIAEAVFICLVSKGNFIFGTTVPRQIR